MLAAFLKFQSRGGNLGFIWGVWRLWIISGLWAGIGPCLGFSLVVWGFGRVRPLQAHVGPVKGLYAAMLGHFGGFVRAIRGYVESTWCHYEE